MSRPITRRGAVLLELAIAVWLLVLLIFGVVEATDFLFVKGSLAGAAREAARAAIPSGATTTDATTAWTTTLTNAGMDTTKCTATFQPADLGAAPSGTQIKVTLSCAWSAVGVGPLNLIKGTTMVTGVAVMQKE